MGTAGIDWCIEIVVLVKNFKGLTASEYEKKKRGSWYTMKSDIAYGKSAHKAFRRELDLFLAKQQVSF